MSIKTEVSSSCEFIAAIAVAGFLHRIALSVRWQTRAGWWRLGAVGYNLHSVKLTNSKENKK